MKPILHAPNLHTAKVLVNVLIKGEPHAWKRASRSGAMTYNHIDNIEDARRLQQNFAAAYPRFQCISQRTLGTQMYFETIYDSKDIDNLEKQVNDALEGVIWNNDCKIKEVYKRVVVLPSRTVSWKNAGKWFHRLEPTLRSGCLQLVVYLLED